MRSDDYKDHGEDSFRLLTENEALVGLALCFVVMLLIDVVERVLR